MFFLTANSREATRMEPKDSFALTGEGGRRPDEGERGLGQAQRKFEVSINKADFRDRFLL